VFSALLADFLFRLTFGVAVAMAVTSSRLVTSGFFRVHLWVLLGALTLAALALFSLAPQSAEAVSINRVKFWMAVTAAIISYVGAVAWLYERPRVGKTAIGIVAYLAFVCAAQVVSSEDSWVAILEVGDRATGGLLLGFVATSMLLGHWYLNTPTMKLEPLRRLIILLVIAVLARMVVSGAGAWMQTNQFNHSGEFPPSWVMFLVFRWLTGLVGTLILAGLTWQTLKIPNTQSATGILYAAVVLTFIGELTSQLMSAETMYPV